MRMDLRLENVSHRYDALAVLDSVDLTARDGEILAIIGPSGCGKSTLLQIAGGLIRPSDGRVTAAGAAPAGCLNPITYVFQDFALLPWRTVEGNISLVLEGHPISREEVASRIANVLERTRLSDFANVYPKQLSGGMKQRVAIARALAVNPAVLLMDEPLSALDSQTRELLMDDLVSLWEREQFTACYITHNLNEAVRLGHRVVVLSRRPGEIRETVDIDIPLSERKVDSPELARTQTKLWEMMREEALTADRQLADA
jgi:NitT/TauT family transport system ATP-binding protein